MLTDKLLRKVSDWRPAGEGRHSCEVVAEEAGWAVTLVAGRVESLGCELWELDARRTTPAGDSFNLADTARLVAGRCAAGLLEPMAVIEVDVPHGEALLRSGSPTRRGDESAYYEARLTAERVGFRRYRADLKAGTRREQVPFALTHEALARLVAGLTGAD